MLPDDERGRFRAEHDAEPCQRQRVVPRRDGWETHNISPAPALCAGDDAQSSTEKRLPLAPVAKADATTPQSLREAQENPYLLLTYKDKDESKMLANPYKESPTKAFGPGWNTNIDALRHNPNVPQGRAPRTLI